MTDLEQNAIDKLDSECEKSPDNMAYRAIEEYLRSRLVGNAGVCGAILAEGKTIAGAYGAMESAARGKKRSGNCVVIAPDEAFKIVDKYYGYGANSQTSAILPSVPAPDPAPKLEVKSIFDLL